MLLQMKDTIYMMPSLQSSAVSIKDWLAIIPTLTGIFVAAWGIRVYKKQQEFTRLQNLSKLFQRFTDSVDLMNVFTTCDVCFPEYKAEDLAAIEAIPDREKLKYTALLEDVALHASHNQVDRQYAIHLFQWHFYYLYNDKSISQAFWRTLGGQPDEKSWGLQMQFAKECFPDK